VTGLLQSIITIVLFILILGVLVVIHELGHFVTARLANVRVLEFGVGFPPRAKVLRVGPPSPADVESAVTARARALALAGDDARRRDEILDEEPATPTGTVYTLNWLPIGGFVKLDGEDGEGADDPRSFSAKSWPTKMLILVAGVAMNIALAFVIFTGIALGGDPTIGITIGTVEPGSPAAAAGIEPGDTERASSPTCARMPARPCNSASRPPLAPWRPSRSRYVTRPRSVRSKAHLVSVICRRPRPASRSATHRPRPWPSGRSEPRTLSA